MKPAVVIASKARGAAASHFAARGWISAALFSALAWGRFHSDRDLRPAWLLAIAAGLAYRVYAARFIRAHSNGGSLSEGPLATGGPYAWGRHPLYLSNLAVALGLVFFAAAFPWWGEALLLAAVTAHYAGLALIEEKFLLDRLGETYARYVRATSRWVGFPAARSGTGGADTRGAAPLSTALRLQAANLAKTAVCALLLWALGPHG